MHQKEIIQDIVLQVRTYGHAMNLIAEKNGFQTQVIPTFKPFYEIHNGQGLTPYLLEIYKNLEPDKLIMTVKRKNGTSYIHPKTFEIEFEQHHEGFNGVPVPNNTPTSVVHRSNFSHTQASDPMTQVYQYQINQLNTDLNKAQANADKFETKYLQLREEKSELKEELQLIHKKHELDQLKIEMTAKNTLSGLASEFRPEIKDIIGIIASKNGAEETTPQLGTGETTKTVAVNQMLGEFNDSQFDMIFEILGRLGQLDDNKRLGVLKGLRKSTPEFNASMEQLNKLSR